MVYNEIDEKVQRTGIDKRNQSHTLVLKVKNLAGLLNSTSNTAEESEVEKMQVENILIKPRGETRMEMQKRS